MTEKQEKDGFLKAEAILRLNIFNEILNAAAMNITNLCNTRSYACSVTSAKTSFYVKLIIELWVNSGIFSKTAA